MIIYNVTVNIDNSVGEEWLKWMRDKHIPDVLKTGMFSKSSILKVMGDEDSGGQTYSIQYTCESLSVYERYERSLLPRFATNTTRSTKINLLLFAHC